MAIQSIRLDPNAIAYSDNEIVAKVNAATAGITRAGAVSPAARPLETGEVTSTHVASGVAKANLDAMTDTTRDYIKTNPSSGEYRVTGLQIDADLKVDVEYDDEEV